MPPVLDWNRAEDPRDVVHLAVQALAEGQVIALPTEAGYVLAASGLQPEAVERLLPWLESGTRLTLCLRSADEAIDYAPGLTAVGQRVANQLLPGPLCLNLPADDPDALLSQLPSTTQLLLLRQGGWLQVGLDAHPAVTHILRLHPGPLVWHRLNPEADSVLQAIGGRDQQPPIGLSIDAGPPKYRGGVTEVEIAGNRLRTVRPGPIDPSLLQQAAQLVILLICTGNTCRSPMAQVLLEKQLRSRFAEAFAGSGPPPAAVLSAGTSAMSGGYASAEAVEAMQRVGCDLSQHRSRPVSSSLLQRADMVLTLTAGHRAAVVGRWPQWAAKVRLLDPDGQDVSDPFGGPLELYQACASQIEHYTQYWVDHIHPNQLPQWV
jgi:protein-tyrosine-phosphatase/tRNA A37 threonylcarbamoyladenosine synthetase subunit TsaC/SUA5/YrdC